MCRGHSVATRLSYLAGKRAGPTQPFEFGSPPPCMAVKQRSEPEVSRALRLERAARGVEDLRRAVLAAEQELGAELHAVAPAMRESAYNLVHYLAVRRHDVRQLQDELARLGLSSLGRMEAHVMASLQAVLEVLHALRGTPASVEAASSARNVTRSDLHPLSACPERDYALAGAAASEYS